MNYLVYIQNSLVFRTLRWASVARGEECCGLVSTAVLVVKLWVGSGRVGVQQLSCPRRGLARGLV